MLCNTAGVLLDPDTYDGYNEIGSDITSHTEAAFEGNPETPYSPVPIFGNKVLDIFGSSIVKFIYPQIEDRLSVIYGNNMDNADPAVAYAIQQSASSPGSPNVIGSGQKLGPNRPLNEVLIDIDVLVVKGLDDRVSSPEAAKSRAELFSKLKSYRVYVETIDNAGHCPHDDAPDKVANAIVNWSASSLSGTKLTTTTTAAIENDAAFIVQE